MYEPLIRLLQSSAGCRYALMQIWFTKLSKVLSLTCSAGTVRIMSSVEMTSGSSVGRQNECLKAECIEINLS